MPPTRNCSRDVLEKVVALVDQLATVVDTFCLSTAVFEAISQKLTVQNTNTKNESNDHTFNTTTDIRETKTDVITETTSLITNISKPNQTVTPFFTASSSSIAKIKNNVASQSPTHTCILEFDGTSKGNPGQAGARAILFWKMEIWYTPL
ncbi:hypothetical protein Tco_0644536 [Tanacetum coccineum]